MDCQELATEQNALLKEASSARSAVDSAYQSDKNTELVTWILFAPAAFWLDGNQEETQKLANEFLSQYNLEADTMGIFVVNANTYDWNIHCDSARLQTRLNFYELTTAPGVVRWFPDTNDGYEEIHKNIEGNEFVDYVWPWVIEFKQQHRDWSKVPPAVWSTYTSCTSALVRTNLPHHVVQGNETRITITCKVVDKDTKSTVNTWSRLQKC